MNSKLNRGAWRTMEKQWADALDRGQSVKINIQPVYSDAGPRPSSFRVEYSVDGSRPVVRIFKNSPGGT